ncbi:MAG: hypothetical protein JXA33_09250 [Anaerolineae bacterium]|nr:hypothetical protein [Anaerolineae bacterium]
MLDISSTWVAAQRDHNYRRTPGRRVTTTEEARAFVDEMGFCHFWPIKDIEMPNLLHAIAGRVRDVPAEHADPDGSKCWGWKDESLGKQWWYYGKLLRRRATLVSLRLLPEIYAASDNFGDIHDYLEEYRDGVLTAEAKDVYEALLEYGPLDTIRLRRESRMSAESAKSRFDRTLVELQVGLKVIPIGVAETGAWHYSFIYEILQRHYPELPEQARQIGRSQAQQTLILQYLKNVVCADRSMVAKVFHILNWTSREFSQAISGLIQKNPIQEMPVEGSKHSFLISR